MTAPDPLARYLSELWAGLRGPEADLIVAGYAVRMGRLLRQQARKS